VPIKKILIANRGEIAVRIIRAARELGIKTVQVMSTADRDMLAVRLADEAIEIGPAQATKSYLRAEAIVSAAAATDADAVHPGYGFLSESADFAAAVEQAGLIFVGPSAETIRQMGDKAAARAIAAAAGVPGVPGSAGRVAGPDEAVAVATAIGYPIMIKAAAGGGGRGIRAVETQEELLRMMPLASAEAAAAFGDGGLYLERFVSRARHVEVQILGDGVDAVHLYERDCSIQRRRQKVWEEAPADYLDVAAREALCESAVRLARAVNYRGAGTLEFLYDQATGEFFFIEMNTRIQVEHPVTEMITGIDIVGQMIRIAGGERLRMTQSDIRMAGHAIECRINAEDSGRDFKPSPGKITGLQVPEGDGIRFDTMLYDGYTVPPFYDSLLGKLIVRGETRADARAKMAAALDSLDIQGLPTTTSLHRALARDPELAAHRTHTGWLESWLAANPVATSPIATNPIATSVEEAQR
jgi:acetyl-CoA carboxylase, biotin carboxylase subunit